MPEAEVIDTEKSLDEITPVDDANPAKKQTPGEGEPDQDGNDRVDFCIARMIKKEL